MDRSARPDHIKRLFHGRGPATGPKRYAIIAFAIAFFLTGSRLFSAGTGANSGAVPKAEHERLSADYFLAEIASIGPRPENSPAERKFFDLVKKTSDRAGTLLLSDDFSDASDLHSFSRILSLHFKGKTRERLVFAFPVNTRVRKEATVEEGEAGGAGLALALATIERLGDEVKAGRVFPLGIEFVFLGGEKRGPAEDGRYPSAGSARWITARSGEDPIALIYFDCDSPPKILSLGNSGANLLSPYWHYERSRKALVDSGFGYRLDANKMQFSRLGLTNRSGPLAPFLAAGIPALEFRGEDARIKRSFASRTVADTAIKLASEIKSAEISFGLLFENIVKENASGFLEEWDRQYVSFQLGSFSAVLREGPYIAFLVCFVSLAAAFLTVLSAARRRRAGHIATRMAPYIIRILMLFLIVTVCYLTTIPLHFIESVILGSAEAWMATPAIFATMRLIVSFALFLASISLLVALRLFTPNPFFYEFAALFCLAIDIFYFTATAPALAFYFAWAFAVVGVSLMIKRPWTSVISFILMYLPILLILGELLADPELKAFGTIVTPSFWEGLAIAASGLPFYSFSAGPLLFFARAAKRSRLFEASVLFAIALIVELGGIAYCANRLRETPSPLELSERIDQDRGLFSASVRSGGRLDELVLLDGSREISFAVSLGEAVAERDDTNKYVRLQESSRRFLGRVKVDLRLSFAVRPYAVFLELAGEDDLRVYDCSLPASASLDGRSLRVFSGVRPGSNLSFNLTMPAHYSARLRVRAEYLDPLIELAAPDGRVIEDRGYELFASFPLDSEASR